MRSTQNRLFPHHRAVAPALLAVAVCLWNWPVFAGRQPAGGDVTTFFYPLMTSYARSLAEGQWPPLWDDHWGYGFPALAESQMGVFYPPHILLFGVLAPATAYSINLLLHMLLAALFAYLAGRTLGLGPMGAGLCGLVFFAGDFFTIHAPHQWAYTTGCWFPLAVLFAWRTLHLPALGSSGGTVLSGEAGQRTVPRRDSWFVSPALLAGVLALQMLGGHFQLAFYTQVTVLALVIGSLCMSGRSWKTRFRTTCLVCLAWFASLLLACVQLLPTAELARQSTLHTGDYEYLSAFANTPWHLINYLSGSLFHTSPLWKGIVWSATTPGAPDAWHTAPEECLNYVGLVPLILAVATMWRGRRDASTRLCTALLLGSLLLSFGPYFPGFRWLIHLPGFAWFRSAARWNLVTTFWLAVLAGTALERLSTLELRRAIRKFAVFWAAMVAVLVVILWSLGRAAPGQSGPVVGTLKWVWLTTSPWASSLSFDQILQRAHTPPEQSDQVVAQLVEAGHRLADVRQAWNSFTIADRWPRLLVRELGPNAAVLGVVLVIGFLPGLYGARLKAALLIIAAVDLAVLATVRPLSWQKAGYLRDSPVLQMLAEPQSGNVHRTVDPLLNLPLVAGAAPILTYRTLDLPVLPKLPLTELADVGSRPVRPEITRAFHLSGVRTVIRRAVLPTTPSTASRSKTTSDPILVAALYGGAYADQLQHVRPDLLQFHVLQWEQPSQAWIISHAEKAAPSTLLQQFPDLRSLRAARMQRVGARHVRLQATVDAPALLLLADLYYPGWEATLETAGSRQTATVLKAFDTWRAIPLPGAGRYRVDLRFRSEPFEWGRWISGSAWTAWLCLLVAFLRRRYRWDRAGGVQ